MASFSNNTSNVNVLGQNFQFAVDVQGSALKATSVTIGSVSVRNTSANFIGTNLDWSSYKKIMLRVDNTLNQPITLTLQLQGVGDYKDTTGATVSITIPATQSNVLITSKEWNILEQPIAGLLALKATAATAPTTGSIAVTAYVAPYI